MHRTFLKTMMTSQHRRLAPSSVLSLSFFFQKMAMASKKQNFTLKISISLSFAKFVENPSNIVAFLKTLFCQNFGFVGIEWNSMLIDLTFFLPTSQTSLWLTDWVRLIAKVNWNSPCLLFTLILYLIYSLAPSQSERHCVLLDFKYFW